jgi:excinuclease UvrABC nuclease subunit
METEAARVRQLFDRLLGAPMLAFPRNRGPIDAPPKQGVYIIYDSDEKVLHVGRTLRAREGLRDRLRAHLRGRSSFVVSFLKGERHLLRDGHSFRYLEWDNDRDRALLEAYATGSLCPAHIGLGRSTKASLYR